MDRRAGAGSFCGARTLAILALAALAYWQETGQGCSLASTPAGAACSGSALSAARIDRSSSGCQDTFNVARIMLEIVLHQHCPDVC